MTILILYTTRYRSGGREMERAASSLEKKKREEFPGARVVCRSVESKTEFVEAVRATPGPIQEFHFIGHSGLYGPMYGTTSRPDQMSRAEWAELEIPFAPNGTATFHCCRSARWFAPYFADRYRIVTYGHRLYTTFSTHPDRWKKVDPSTIDGEVYVVSTPGFKSQGVVGTLKKRLGRSPVLPLTRFEPSPEPGKGTEEASYDRVADLYDQVFEDFRVRADEWRWLSPKIPTHAEVLDIGCGNGALLLALAPMLKSGIGLDASKRMISIAERRASGEPNLKFKHVASPSFPLPDQSVDVVVSMLSWRYLDWDPIEREIRRVLRPGGRLLIVDMVASPLKVGVLGRVLTDRFRTILQGIAKPSFRRSLRRLVEDPKWGDMLRHNPMRAEHEYRWYLPSRFPGGTFDTLNRAPRTEILAFHWEAPTGDDPLNVSDSG